MRSTLVNNFFLEPLFYWFSKIALFFLGWKTKGKAPEINKFVLIAAPHSSNWDFVLFLLIIFKLKISVHWMGKNTMFIWPFRWFLKRLGGIPINRTKKSNIVQLMKNAFKESEKLILTIAPSGTRGKTVKWKSGFYHIACESEVPIVFGFIDYPQKVIGIGPAFSPTGKIEEDMKVIKKYYSQFSGKFPLIES